MRDAVTIAQAEVRLDDPHLTTDNRDRLGIRSAVYDALVARRADGSFAPALAASWEVAADARTWRFTPRDGVRFHDGSPLLGADIVASLERVRQPARGGEYGAGGVIPEYLADATVDLLPDGGVSFVTGRPMADLLDILVDIAIVPEAVSEGADAVQVGTGPYRIVDVAPDAIRAERFAAYWAGEPAAASVTWRREPDAGARADLLLSGAADLISNLADADRARIAASDGLWIVDAPSTTAVAFLCNAAHGLCRDKRVRQALNYAVDVARLIEATGRAGARPLNGPLTELHDAYDPATAPYPYDPERARALLADAKLGDGLHLTLDVPERMPDEAPLLGAMLAEQFAAIGIETEVRAFADRPGYADMVRAKQIDDACCFDSTPLSGYRVLREKLHSGVRGPWWQGYENPKVDRLLDEAAASVDHARRIERYRRAYRLIHDDAPWIFLYSPRNTWAAAADVAWRPSRAGVIQLSGEGSAA